MVGAGGDLSYIDFGKVGFLGEEDRFALMALVVHFVNRDAAGLARDFSTLGFVAGPDGSVLALEAALADALALRDDREIFGAKRERTSFAGVLAFLREALPEKGGEKAGFSFALPPRFSPVVRALGALEGAVLAVDGSFEVVSAAYPHVARALFLDGGDR